MDTLDAERNGHAPLRTPKATPVGDRSLPDKTKVDVDLAHRLMLEDYIGWYYPGVKATLDTVVGEMISIAHGRAKTDVVRTETPEARRDRLANGS